MWDDVLRIHIINVFIIIIIVIIFRENERDWEVEVSDFQFMEIYLKNLRNLHVYLYAFEYTQNKTK